MPAPGDTGTSSSWTGAGNGARKGSVAPPKYCVVMGALRRSNGDRGEPAERMRHRSVPHREFGATLVVARPRDGEAVVMTSTAVVVWHLLDDWTTERDVDRALAERFPEVATGDRTTARLDIVRKLHDDDLLERG